MGRQGGKALAEKMTPEERKASAQNAARARWGSEASEEEDGEQGEGGMSEPVSLCDFCTKTLEPSIRVEI